MWKIVALSALALLAALGSTVDGATAQTPPPSAPAATPTGSRSREVAPGKRTPRHASRHHRRRHAASFKCFGQEWRAFPTRDPKGYFYTPPGGGIC